VRALRTRRRAAEEPPLHPFSRGGGGIGSSGETGGEAAPSSGPRFKEKPKSPAASVGDFVLGLSIRRHIAGYALLRFRDLEPLQFGLIDVRKSMEVQQKALEIGAVLRDLRNTAPQKLQRVASEQDLDDFDLSPSRQWLWHVSVDDSTIDRSPPTNAGASATQRAIAMLQGLVIGDSKRLFKVAPALVHPRRSRQLLGVRGLGPTAREQVHEIATSRVHDFPEVRKKSGTLSEDTLLMSDAWASARYTQRAALVALKKSDAQLVEELRRQALRSRKIQRMQEAVRELQPRKAGAELAQVLESRVQKMIEDGIHRMLDKELEAASAPPAAAPGRRSEAPWRSRADQIMEAEMAESARS